MSVGLNGEHVLVDIDPSSGRYRLGRREVPIAGAVAFTAGDAVHNLRSTLDHLVWQLRIANEGDPPDPLPSDWRNLQFPICDSLSNFTDESNRRLCGLGAQSVQYIQDHQPFMTPDPADPTKDSLVVLRTLSNVDKHRTPLLAVRYLYEIVKIPDTGEGDMQVLIDVPGEFPANTVIATTDFPPWQVSCPHVGMRIGLVFLDAISLIGTYSAPSILTDIADFVEYLLIGASRLPGTQALVP